MKLHIFGKHYKVDWKGIRELPQWTWSDMGKHLPVVPIVASAPNKVVVQVSDGSYLCSKNFSDPAPTWKRYKKYGWVLRYFR